MPCGLSGGIPDREIRLELFHFTSELPLLIQSPYATTDTCWSTHPRSLTLTQLYMSKVKWWKLSVNSWAIVSLKRTVTVWCGHSLREQMLNCIPRNHSSLSQGYPTNGFWMSYKEAIRIPRHGGCRGYTWPWNQLMERFHSRITPCSYNSAYVTTDRIAQCVKLITHPRSLTGTLAHTLCVSFILFSSCR